MQLYYFVEILPYMSVGEDIDVYLVRYVDLRQRINDHYAS